MSNAYAAGYKEYVNIDGRDQYGQSMKLENETYQIVENSTNKVSMATYDPATDRMVFDVRKGSRCLQLYPDPDNERT